MKQIKITKEIAPYIISQSITQLFIKRFEITYHNKTTWMIPRPLPSRSRLHLKVKGRHCPLWGLFCVQCITFLSMDFEICVYHNTVMCHAQYTDTYLLGQDYTWRLNIDTFFRGMGVYILCLVHNLFHPS
jgi:hypothetical protein